MALKERNYEIDFADVLKCGQLVCDVLTVMGNGVWGAGGPSWERWHIQGKRTSAQRGVFVVWNRTFGRKRRQIPGNM